MDALLTTLRVVVSLAAVLGLVWLLARAARRRGAGGAGGSTEFAVITRQALGRSAGVAVVRVGDQALVLGVTEQSVRLLAQTPLTDVLPGAGPEGGAPPTALPAPVGSDALPHRRELVPARGRRAVVAPTSGALAGSALSLATWSAALDVLRDRTTRR